MPPRRVFLSYSRRNQYIAERLKLDLERAGVTVWWDQRSIPLGDKWMQSIENGIRESETFFYLWSPESSVSPFVQREYEAALQCGRRPLVLRVAGTDAEMPSHVRDLQFIDLVEDYWSRLKQVLSDVWNLNQAIPTSRELVDRGARAADARSELRDMSPRVWTVLREVSASGNALQRFVRIPFVPGGYATSWLVVEESAVLRLGSDLHVVLKFSGDRDRDVVQEVLEYTVSKGVSPMILLLEGPINSNEQQGKDRRVYEIPNDQGHIWQDCVDLAVRTIGSLHKGRTLHFFCDSPQALVFPIAARLREIGTYRVYNLARNETAENRYRCVYEGRPT